MKNVLIKKFQKFKKIVKKIFKKISKIQKKFSKIQKNFQKYKIYPSCVTIGDQKLLPLFA